MFSGQDCYICLKEVDFDLKDSETDDAWMSDVRAELHAKLYKPLLPLTDSTKL